MRKLLCLLAVTFLFSIPSIAACNQEGQHVTLSTLTAIGGAAGVTFPLNTNCFFHITHIQAGMVMVVANSGAQSAALSIYYSGACNGTSNGLQQLAVTGTVADSSAWEFRAGTEGDFKISTAVCVGFDYGRAGVIESVLVSGFYSGT